MNRGACCRSSVSYLLYEHEQPRINKWLNRVVLRTTAMETRESAPRTCVDAASRVDRLRNAIGATLALQSSRGANASSICSAVPAFVASTTGSLQSDQLALQALLVSHSKSTFDAVRSTTNVPEVEEAKIGALTCRLAASEKAASQLSAELDTTKQRLADAVAESGRLREQAAVDAAEIARLTALLAEASIPPPPTPTAQAALRPPPSCAVPPAGAPSPAPRDTTRTAQQAPFTPRRQSTASTRSIAGSAPRESSAGAASAAVAPCTGASCSRALGGAASSANAAVAAQTPAVAFGARGGGCNKPAAGAGVALSSSKAARIARK